ncbi:MAG: type I polyketide synthase, partial [Ktedonobacteraceae bacterium]
GKIDSPDGFCRPFDARAQGSVLSNGAAVVALKRFQDALTDGDHIYALIRGSAMNNDGSQRVSYTAPGLDGQASVIASALSYAGVNPETITYLETNGTGTRLGDAIELAAMTKAFAGKTQKRRFCAISSLKPNVGHLDRASGVAGLIKTMLAMSQGQLPPQMHYEQPSPEMDLYHSPFYVNTKLAPWPRQQTPRRAGVNSFGLGGTNVHLVIEEGPARESGEPGRSCQLLLLSAKSTGSLQEANRKLVAHLKAHPEQALADVAYTLQVGRCAFNYRQCILAQTAEEACAALEQQQEQWTHQEHRDRAVTFVFSGSGDLAMALRLSRQEPQFRETVARCCQMLPEHLRLDLQALLLPEQTDVSVPETLQPELRPLALFISEYALAHLLMEWHVYPQALFGAGSGAYVAACLAGVLSLEDALTVVARRAQLIAEQPEGVMLIVAQPEEVVRAYLTEQICLAIVNGPNACVLAGPAEAIKELELQLEEQEIACRRVETTHAFHSTMLNQVRAPLTDLMRTIKLQKPHTPYISNVTGTWITDQQATDPEYWAQHMCQTVYFAQGIETLLQKPERALVEVGLGQSLSSFVKQHPASSREHWHLILSLLPALNDRQTDYACLLTTL